MNNQSLDRVREEIEGLFLKFEGVEPEEDTVKMMLHIINSELQNLRAELAKEVEGLKKEFDLSMLDVTGSEIDTHNEAIDKVLAIIKETED